eukprot:300156-Rhodomonas_salina.2
MQAVPGTPQAKRSVLVQRIGNAGGCEPGVGSRNPTAHCVLHWLSTNSRFCPSTSAGLQGVQASQGSVSVNPGRHWNGQSGAGPSVVMITAAVNSPPSPGSLAHGKQAGSPLRLGPQ